MTVSRSSIGPQGPQGFQGALGSQGSQGVQGTSGSLASAPFLRTHTLHVAYDGSDANDGLDEHTPFLTIAHAASVALADPNKFSDILVWPGLYTLSDTLVVPQAVRLRGFSWQAYPQGVSIVWNGVDDARPWIQTATDTTHDWSTGLIEGFTLVAQSTQTSGAAAIQVRNAQNGSVLRDIRVGVAATTTYHPPSGPAFDFTETGGGATGEPGYVEMHRCWSMRSPIFMRTVPVFTQMVLTMCGCDGPKTGSADAVIRVIADTGTHPNRPEDGVIVLDGFKFEGDGSVPMHGIYAQKAVSLVVNGGAFKTSGPTASHMVYYDAPVSASQDPANSLPVDLHQVGSQGFANWIYAPQQGITISADNTGGSVKRRSFHGVLIPGVWDGTHSGLVSDGLTVNITSPAANGVSVSPAPGQTGDLARWSGTVFGDSYTRADSASTLGSSEIGGGAYTAERGTWGITGNKAYLATATDDSSAAVDAGVADGTLLAQITLNATGANAFPGVQFRHTDLANGLLVRFKGSTGEMFLKKRVTSAETSLVTVTGITYTGGTTHQVMVTLNGALIEVYWDAVKKISYTLTSGEQATFLTPTKIGLRTNGLVDSGTTGSVYDNLYFASATTRVDANGQLIVPKLKHTATTAATTLGTVVGKMPIVDATGTTRYVAFYDAIT